MLSSLLQFSKCLSLPQSQNGDSYQTANAQTSLQMLVSYFLKEHRILVSRD